MRRLDHFITSPDTPVCWIFCVNIWYYRFPFSLDRPIPIEIIILIIFPVRCKKYFKKENSLDLHTFSAIGSRLATACSRVGIIVVVCQNQTVVKSENSVDNSGKNTETLVTRCVFVHINRKSFLLCTMIVGSLMWWSSFKQELPQAPAQPTHQPQPQALR